MSRLRALSREDGVALLRAARNAFASKSDKACELVGWAFAAMRDRPHVQRLKIDYLLQSQQYDSADALIARCIMQGEDHPLLRWRYARSLFEQGRTAQARIEIERILAARPRHCGALMLAARIAASARDHRTAVLQMVYAVDERPRNLAMRCMLIQTMLDAGMIEQANLQLASLSDPPVLLLARARRAQGRLLEAIEILKLDMTRPSLGNHERDSIACELIDSMEQAGDAPGLRTLLPSLTADHPRAMLRAAQAALTIGDFARASALVRLLRQNPASTTMRSDVAMIELVANHGNLSAPPLSLHNVPAQSRRMASATWLRGMIGHVIQSQIDGVASGTDPKSNTLRGVLHSSALTLKEAMRTSNSPTELAGIEKHLRKCAAALHASPQAISTSHPENLPAMNATSDQVPLRQAA